MQATASEPPSEPTPAPVPTSREVPRAPIAALLHRWLVEYNPLSLFSAALVYGGLTLVSRDVAGGASLWAHLGGWAIAEVYAFALIGAAAFLVRIGQRRAAVMLGLLAVLFAADVTLHVETCTYLGAAGVVASAMWLILLAAKLRALTWALELRPSHSVIGTISLGALGLAALPHALRDTHLLDASSKSALVTLFLFALASAALWTRRNVDSAAGWDVRGRRCITATWGIWGAMVLLHALFWSSDYRFDLGLALTAVPLVALRFVRRERVVWIVVAATLALAPSHHLWVVALMSAVTLALTATRAAIGHAERDAATPRSAPPYRSIEALHPPAVVWIHRVDPSAKARLLVGAGVSVYVALWSATTSHGAHHLWLDAALCLGCIVAARHWRRPMLVAPLVPMLVHLAVQRGLITKPTSALAWGVVLIVAGFTALAASVLASWWLARRPSRDAFPVDGGS